jgi:membrane associated rhomboid family serine protease
VIPLTDENPVRRRPLVTFGILAACLAIYFLWQPSFGGSDVIEVDTPAGTVQMGELIAFNLERAAIPCEVVQGEPLTLDEAAATYGRSGGDGEDCGAGSRSSPELFPHKSVWLSLVTSMFLHGGLLHLGGNLLFLWVFGNNVEDHLGHVGFALFYVLGGLAAAAVHIALNPDSTIPVVGASGAIAAVMGAYLVWFPRARVRTLIFLGFFITVIAVPAAVLLGLWFLMQFFTDPNSGVAWAAHVGGFVFGVVVGLLVRGSGRLRRAAWTDDHRPGPGWSGERRSSGRFGASSHRARRGRW